jgi:hypothetical protein
MKKLLIFILLFMQQTWALDSEVISVFSTDVQNKVVRAYYDDVLTIQSLSEITVPWEVNTKQKYAVFMLESKKDFDRIQKLGFILRIDTKRQAKLDYDRLTSKSAKAQKGVSGISGFSCYSTVEETLTRMDTMAVDYPNFTEIISIGSSWEKTINAANGYDMRVLKVTNKNIIETKPVLFIASAIHAREYATAELNTRFAEYLLSHYETDSDIKWMLDHQEVHFLLHNNPDGRKMAEAQVGGSPGWRKNTNQAYCSPASNSRGADLNRNFPFGWLSSSSECSDTHSGSGPESEPEISSLVTYINTIYDDNRGPNIIDAAPETTPGVFVDVHSYSELILWPWGFTSGLSPNESQFAAFGRRVAYFNDYTPQRAAQLYTAAGVSIDTTYGDLGVASLVYELGTAFYQDCATFESQILPDNLQSLLYVSRVTRTPYISPFGPDIENLSILPNVILINESTSINGVANDDRYNHSNGAQSVGQVQNVEYFVNDLPWLTASGTSLDASDGVFDSVLENFDGVVSGSDLVVGQNTIFVVATDNTNKQGAVYSKFVDLVTPAQVATFSGRTLDAVTGLPIGNVTLEINNSSASSDASGNYSQNVLPILGADVVTQASGYVTQVVDNLDIIAGQNVTKDFQLEPFCDYSLDTIEAGVNSWVADTPWGITADKSVSPSHSWTDSPSGQYQNNISVSLTSELIDVASFVGLKLSFNSYCDTEANYDYGHVEVRFDGGDWSEVYRCNGDASWKNINQDISIQTGSNSMQYRFRLTSDGSVTNDGWYLDDVKIIVAGQVCHASNPDVLFENSFE